MDSGKRCLGILLLAVAIDVHGATSATITGSAKDGGAPRADVLVTISSPTMQGTRSARTDVNGRFAFVAVPPGEYAVRFDFAEGRSVTMTLRAGLGQTARADATAPAAAGEADQTVVAPVDPAVETKSSQTSLVASVVDLLPVGRDPATAVALAAGTQGTAISGGAVSSWLMDGGDVNDVLGRAPMVLYVEDAIQETTLLSAAIPVEYGRFSGGVVNTITKSGGEAWSGSVRDSVSNPAWTARTPFQNVSNTDELEQTFEATLGGGIVDERVWFFGAGRYFADTVQKFYARSPSWGFTQENDDRRWLAKLTGTALAGHTVAGSVLDYAQPQDNYCFSTCAEPSNVDASRSINRRLTSFSYEGVLRDHLVVEGYWSGTNVRFEDSGGPSRDQATGTLGVDDNTGAYFGAPVFCGSCGSATTRSRDTWGVKTTWVAASKALGTHMLAVGYDESTSDSLENNYQSGSDFILVTLTPQNYDLRPGDVFRPTIAPGDFILWMPILVLDRASDQRSSAAFVSDTWDLGAHWSFNIGVRYDRNDIVDEAGLLVSDAGALQPRLAAAWDLRGDGRYRVNLSWGRYADTFGRTVGSATWPGGNPVELDWTYDGPLIDGLPTFEAFAKAFAWFNAQCDAEGRCGKDNLEALYWAGGGNAGIQHGNSLESMKVDEASLGFSWAGSSNAWMRLDGVVREWSDFLVRRATMATGQTEDLFGNAVDVVIWENGDRGLERRYDAVMLQGGLRLGRRWHFGGNYTWSQTTGNVNPRGTYPANGPDFYPELDGFERHNPVGDLEPNHKVRAWLLYDLPTAIGAFDFSLLQSYDSGRPYSLTGGISTRFDPAARTRYANESDTTSYFFSERGAFHWDGATSRRHGPGRSRRV
jgi:hypothetical protein